MRGIPSLRKFDLARAVGQTMRAITQSHTARRTSFRVTHFSIQSNHIHLIVEAGSKTTLMKSLRGLGIWLARRVNERLERRGRVIAERYHARALTTPRAVRNAIVYVLKNASHCTSFSKQWRGATAAPIGRSALWMLFRRLQRRYGSLQHPIGDLAAVRAPPSSIDVDVGDGVCLPDETQA